MSVTGQTETAAVKPLGERTAGPANTPGAANSALKEPPPKQGDGVDPRHKLAARMVVTDSDGGVVSPPVGEARRKSVAICGFASQTRKYILKFSENPNFEIWGLNQLYRHIPRADRWFDIHYNWDKEVVPGTDHREWAKTCGIPFYTIARQPDVPTSVRYPIEKVMEHFGGIDYFTSTIPYMIALAVMEIDEDVDRRMAVELDDYVQHRLKAASNGEPPTDAPNFVALQRQLYGEYSIGVFGIDLVVGGEYFHEKPCAEFWIGAAALGRGINLLIPPESALCKQLWRYGYDPEPNQFLRSAEIHEHSKQMSAERDELMKRLCMVEGVLQANGRWADMIELRSRGSAVA